MCIRDRYWAHTHSHYILYIEKFFKIYYFIKKNSKFKIKYFIKNSLPCFLFLLKYYLIKILLLSLIHICKAKRCIFCFRCYNNWLLTVSPFDRSLKSHFESQCLPSTNKRNWYLSTYIISTTCSTRLTRTDSDIQHVSG